MFGALLPFCYITCKDSLSGLRLSRFLPYPVQNHRLLLMQPTFLLTERIRTCFVPSACLRPDFQNDYAHAVHVPFVLVKIWNRAHFRTYTIPWASSLPRWCRILRVQHPGGLNRWSALQSRAVLSTLPHFVSLSNPRTSSTKPPPPFDLR